LWSEHTGRQDRAATGSKLDALSHESDLVDGAAHATKQLNSALSKVDENVRRAHELIHKKSTMLREADNATNTPVVLIDVGDNATMVQADNATNTPVVLIDVGDNATMVQADNATNTPVVLIDVGDNSTSAQADNA
jgi:microcystin degradation protein MlrC